MGNAGQQCPPTRRRPGEKCCKNNIFHQFSPIFSHISAKFHVIIRCREHPLGNTEPYTMPKFIAPTPAKVTKEMLKHSIDEVAKIRQRIAALKRQEEELTQMLLSKLPDQKIPGTMEGYKFVVAMADYSTMRLDQKKVAKALTEAQYKKCLTKVPCTKLVFAKI